MTRVLSFLLILSNAAYANNTEHDFQKYLHDVNKFGGSALKTINSFDEKELPKYKETPSESKYYTQGEKDKLANEAKLRMKKEDEAGSIAVEEMSHRESVELNDGHIKRAEKSQNASSDVIKGTDIDCKNDECLKIEKQDNDEFEEVLTKVSSATAAGDEYSKSKNQNNRDTSENAIRMFSGQAMTCRKRPIGYLDCCSDKGWGKNLNLAKCPAEDKALGKAKLNYIAHYLGEYCAKWIRWPGGKTCKERRRTYCVFSSKMARIIHEEGRLKYNSAALGNAKHPRCRGITAKQFESINVKDIDFINPIYPWNGGSGPHNRKAGVAGDITLNDPKGDIYTKKVDACRKNHKEDGVCAL